MRNCDFRTSLSSTISSAVIAALALSTTLSAQVGPNSTQSGGVEISGAEVTLGGQPAALARALFLEAHPQTGTFILDGVITRVYGKAFSSGINAVDSAERFLQAHAAMFGSSFNQLMPIGPNGDGTHVLPMGYRAEEDAYRFSLVGYTQHLNGVPVFRGDVRCLVRNEPGYPLVLVSNQLRDVSALVGNTKVRPIAPSKLDLKKATRSALNQFGPGATVSDAEQVIWAGYDNAPATEARVAVKFIVTGTGVFDRGLYQRMLYVVDSATGRILFQEDQVLNADVNVTVTGLATTGSAAAACNTEVAQPLPYARITYGTTTLYANAAGTLTIPNISTSTSFTSVVSGQWFGVNDVANGSVGSIALSSAGGALSFVHNAANTAEDQLAEVNAYIHANKIRDLTLAANPSFPSIGTQTNWPINVQVTGSCNAFYNGTSINFYPSGGGCNNTAFAAVVHHEYGHHLVNRAGSGQGEYGEGFGDICSVLVLDEPRLAVGFQTCSTGIRNADNTCQYFESGCSSCGSAIHSCGQLISGCLWDLRENLLLSQPATYRTTLANLAIDSVLLHTGTGIAPDITIDFLTLDDNDSNIANGTPNYADINNAFTLHAMPGPALQLIGFSFPSGQPDFVSPAGGATIDFNVSAVAGTPAAGSGKFYYRVGPTGTFTQASVASLGANSYRATLPSAPCGSTIQYYVSADATSGAVVNDPIDAPASFYAVVAATGLDESFVDTVETTLGWTLSTAGDTATAGLWTRGDPLGTISGTTQVQPENDVTANPGVNCFFTGQGTGGTLGQADVDGGFTTLTSPTMDASGGAAYISYFRWYSNQQGGSPNADTFRVQISNNNGATWTALETVGPTGPEVNGGWIFKEFLVSDFVTPTAQVKVRFIADDAGAGSLIEAAVDEVRMKTVACGNPADLNGDGSIDAADLAILLSNWGVNGVGDINGDGSVEATDLAILLGQWGI
jgi:hypothetical protein